ncbi:MAG: hypothetical protein JJU11_15295 [Candidatus Sumerlaeia bacterium]|nr:hypothetical protein [Candidatus Sumerlaeia bacterium]
MSLVLEIVIYLTDGSFHRYKQNDPAKINDIINTLQPPGVFSQKQLLIAGSYYMSGIPSQNITRIDIIGVDLPKMRHGASITHIEEISEHELDLYAKPRYSDTRRSEMVVNVGQQTESVAEINLIDTQRIGFKFRYQADIVADRRQLMQVFTSTMPIFGNRLGGGVMFLNPLNVVRWAFYPGIPEAPRNAMALHRAEIFGDSAPSMIIQKLDAGDDDTNLG